MLRLSSPLPPRSPSIQQLGRQQLLSWNEVELMGKGCQDDWTTKVGRIITRFLMPGNYLLGIAAGLFLQKKHLNFAEYETIDAKEQQATAKPELCPVLVHPRNLGPQEGTTPGTPFTETGLRRPASEAPTPQRPSTRRKDPKPRPHPYSPRSTTAAKRNGHLLPIVDGPDTDIKAKGRRSIQPEGVQMPSLPPVGVKPCPAEVGGAKVQVYHLPVLALDSNTTDPLLSCTLEEIVVAVKTQPGNQGRRLPEFPA